MASESFDLLITNALLDAFKKIRGGLGWHDDGQLAAVPEYVRSNLGVDPSIDEASQCEFMADRVRACIRRLPEESQEYISLAFNDGNSKHQWMARCEDCANTKGESARTIVRRADAALKMLAVALLLPKEEEPDTGGDENKLSLIRLKGVLDKENESETIWQDAQVRVFSDHVTVREERRIRSLSDGVDNFVVTKTFPWASTEVESSGYEGARMLELEQPNPNFVVELFELPRPLAKGEFHNFTVEHKTRKMAPMYVVSPTTSFSKLVIRLQFEDVRPSRVWSVEKFPIRLLQTEDIHAVLHRHASEIELDKNNYYRYEAHSLKIRTTNGVAWQLPQEEKL